MSRYGIGYKIQKKVADLVKQERRQPPCLQTHAILSKIRVDFHVKYNLVTIDLKNISKSPSLNSYIKIIRNGSENGVMLVGGYSVVVTYRWYFCTTLWRQLLEVAPHAVSSGRKMEISSSRSESQCIVGKNNCLYINHFTLITTHPRKLVLIIIIQIQCLRIFYLVNPLHINIIQLVSQ